MGAKPVDEESSAIMHRGANLSQLGKLFRMDHRVLVEKLQDVPPSGEYRGHPVYFVHEVAPYLVKPIYDIETYMRRMHHNELPKLLTKEFWAGQRSRQEYELKAGDLWPTARVITAVGDLMKLVKMSVRLLADQVNRQSELSPTQRQIIVRQGDSLLEELHQNVIQAFKTKPTNPVVIEAAEEAVKHVIAPDQDWEDDDEL